MIQYLIVILDYSSVPFCSYETPGAKDRLISFETLQKTVDYAIRNNLSINFLYGDRPLPGAYKKAIEGVDHVKIVSIRHAGEYPDAVFVAEHPEDGQYFPLLPDDAVNNVILRVGKVTFGSLSSTVGQLIRKVKRLNIIIKDMHAVTHEDLVLYAAQLSAVREILEKEYGRKNFIEVNAVSDRLFLTNMNNCCAGTRHMTVAPNGKFYLCPAFYFEDERDSAGSLVEGINVQNPQLLELKHAPVCLRCDAWHCKRCIYLNRKLTLELNTPSREQCMLAHYEREQSRLFLDNIEGAAGFSGRVTQIPQLNYSDPFELLTDRSVSLLEKEGHFSGLLAKPLENVPLKDLFRQIYSIDPNIITRLKEMNHFPPDPEKEE